MALTKVSTPGIKDEAITLAKLLHGDSNSNGKFLRANNGADPSFETIDLTALSASNLTSGTIPDARFPSALPAIDGSALTGITSTTINNNADNRVITGSGTANTLESESNLTFTSNVLKVQNGVSDANDSNLLHAVAGGTATRGIMLGTGRATGASQNDGMGYIDAIDSDSNNYGAQLQFRIGGTRVMVIGYNSNDNVGIGNDYPLKKLTVQADQNTHGIFLTQSNDYDSGWGFHADDTSGALKIDRSINNNFGYRRATFHQDGGLCFGSDTAAANALDDYEEGTWTPQISFGYNTYNQSYSYQQGQYTKIGNRVFLTCYVAFSNKGTASGVARLGGLPFSNANISVNYAHGSAWINGWNGGATVPTGYVEVNSSNYRIERQRTDNPSSSFGVSICDNTNFNNGTDMMLNLQYRVN